jgi:hypothetical protein
MGQSRKGKPVLKRKTDKKKYRSAPVRMNERICGNRHQKKGKLIRGINQKLRDYYNYYGITFI